MKVEGLFAAINISATGLRAQRKRMNAIANNLANVETTRTESGGPYKRQIVVMTAGAKQSFAQLVNAEHLRLETTDNAHIASSGSDVVFEEGIPAGVETEVMNDTTPPRIVYDPSHPDANADGYVQMPNINLVTEMVDMISASRAYEANVTAINAAKNMAKDALEI